MGNSQYVQRKAEKYQIETGVTKVRNVDGAIEEFDVSNLIGTIVRAALSEGVKSKTLAKQIAGKTKIMLDKKFGSAKIPTVKDIQLITNSLLIKAGFPNVAKRYLAYRKRGCKFCAMHRDKGNIIYENPHIVVVFGRAHHKGHLVVLTKAHEEHLLLLHPATLDSFMNDTIKVCKALYKAIRFDRINMEYLDNWDSHIHWNIYPRFKKDKDWNQPPYIPKKNEKFKEQYLNWKEIEIFRNELRKLMKDGF